MGGQYNSIVEVNNTLKVKLDKGKINEYFRIYKSMNQIIVGFYFFLI